MRVWLRKLGNMSTRDNDGCRNTGKKDGDAAEEEDLQRDGFVLRLYGQNLIWTIPAKGSCLPLNFAPVDGMANNL